MKRGIAKIWAGALSASMALGAFSLPAHAAGTRMTLANGLSLTVYDADYLATRVGTLDGSPAIRLDDGRYLPVRGDTARLDALKSALLAIVEGSRRRLAG